MIDTVTLSVFPTALEASRTLALEVAAQIRAINQAGRHAVLGLATGSSPILLYDELIRLHREQSLSFARVITFNLDEYCGLSRADEQSYVTFMHEHLFDHVDIPAANIHLPSGTERDATAHCAAYERMIAEVGGIDFQLVGIGRIGHIGFNEPGSAIDSRTRKVELSALTREDAAAAFGGLAHVPSSAITMGCGTILAARRIAFIAFGAHKAGIVQRALEGPVTEQVPASFLRQHGNAHYFLDEAAAAQLG